MPLIMAVLLYTAGLFVGMLVCLEIGRRISVRRLASDPEGATVGIGTVEGAVFGLLALLVAFTFSGAAARFDTRRQLIVEETNDIGTAYLRLDLLPPSAQPALRESFRQYVGMRLEVYRKLPDMVAATQELAKATQFQGHLWRQAVAACQEAPPAATMLLLPALNAMIDITTTRTMSAQMHPPTIIFAMLFVVALASALLAGHGLAGGKRRNWLHMPVSTPRNLATPTNCPSIAVKKPLRPTAAWSRARRCVWSTASNAATNTAGCSPMSM
jgi:hypothetical protein